MHELGLCDAMLRMVRDIVKEEKPEGVSSVTVEVGTLSGVIPHFLTDCWNAVIDGTEFQDTKLIVETIQGKAQCFDCGCEFTADVEKLVCPECGSSKLTPISGRDMTIKEVEIY